MLSQRNDRIKPSLEETIEALKMGEYKNLPGSDLFYGLSDLSSDEVAQIQPVWGGLKPSFRRQVIVALAESSETNFELNYHEFGLLGLNDESATVRSATIELLWEDESIELLHKLIDLALNDSSVDVRATAVNALGRFISLGEFEEIPAHEAELARSIALQLFNDRSLDTEIRRRALEAISNSSLDLLPKVIKESYQSDDQKLQVSSIFAMGRSCDPQWADIILKELESNDPEKRYEATRASGELELVEAIPMLARLLIEDDREVKETAIWSLGEIGGREAIRILDAFLTVAEEDEDDILIEAVEDAMGNASFLGSGMFDPFQD